MAENDNTNNAGDMTINIGGGGASMDCGCHGHCCCGRYSHGHGHGHHGGTVVTKRTTNVIYGGDNANNGGDGGSGTACCEEPVDVSLASGVVDGNNLVLTLTNGELITIDVTGLVGGGSNVTGLTLAGGILTLTQGGGGDQTVDLSSLAGGGTNVNAVSGTVTGNTLTIELSNGNSFDIDVTALTTTGTGGLTSVSVTGGLLSGDGTGSNPLTITAANFATWLADAANAAACAAVRACVAAARIISSGVEFDALDSSTGVMIKDAAGNLACAPFSAMLPDISGGVASPFATGGNPAAWLASDTISTGGGQSYTVPAGPTSDGYWHLEFDSATDYTWTVSTGAGAVVGTEAIVAPGATIQQTLSGGPGASMTFVTGHWHATS